MNSLWFIFTRYLVSIQIALLRESSIAKLANVLADIKMNSFNMMTGVRSLLDMFMAYGTHIWTVPLSNAYNVIFCGLWGKDSLWTTCFLKNKYKNMHLIHVFGKLLGKYRLI